MIGTRLSHYRLIDQIGAGGMGVVYRAHDEHLDRDVAVKVLPAGTLTDDVARRRFRHEALALSRLNHPHICGVHDFDSQDGVDFLVMDLVAGETLADRLRTGPLPEAEIVALAIQIAGAMEVAHEQGVVHRDLKPGNVMVTPRGDAMVLDFGLARRFAGTGSRANLTTVSEADAFSGTLPYMAPEQLRGGDVDGRTDLYALGVMLYEMATGRRPFEAAHGGLLAHAILNGSPVRLRSHRADLSPRLETIILNCLEREPAARYQNARALIADLRSEAKVVRHRGPILGRRIIIVAAVAAAATALLAVAALDIGGLRSRLTGGERIRSLAVLPLENLSGDPEQAFFADGMTEELINRLAQIGSLTVSSRNSVMAFKGTRTPVPEVARRLNVTAVVVGSVRRAGNRVRISVQLVQAASDKNLWSSSYERDLEDVFTLQSEVANSIAARVRVSLTPRERARLMVSRRVDPAAHEEYLKGRFYWNQYTEAGYRTALKHFNRAIEIDPTFALGYVGVSDAYAGLSFMWMPPSVAMPKAAAAADRALELDPELPEAYSARGYVRAFHDWKWREGESDFRRTIALNPGNAIAHVYYGSLLIALGRIDDAIVQLRKAQELDPLSPMMTYAQLWPLFEGRRYDEAIVAAEQVIREDSLAWNAHNVLAQALLQKGEFERAIRVLRNRMRLMKETGSGGLAYAHALQGKRDLALAELEQLKVRGTAYDAAKVYGALGMPDQAFEWLEKDMQTHSESVVYLKVDPELDPLRSDPRFALLLKRVGLAP